MLKKFVLKVNKIKKKFAEKVVLDDVSFSLYFGEKVGFVGSNGSGKSTLAKIISGLEKSDEGDIEIYKNFKISYLPQEFSENISVEKYLEIEQKKISEVLKILADFGFCKAEIFSKISKLSAGMRGRGKIALMLSNNPNVLVLDEPTNNLDLEVLEKFEKALKDYEGTIIFASHDKYFIEKIKPNKFLEMKEKK